MAMMAFTEYLAERYINLFTPEDKTRYKEEVFRLLQASYASLGGLKGSGFASPDDMVSNIPFWKLVRKDGKIVALAMYKDKAGRKRVAVASDGTEQGKNAVASIFREDFSRAYFEISEKSLSFHVKIMGYENILKVAVNPSKVSSITGDEVHPIESGDKEATRHPQLKDFFYRRDIGGKLHTKILLGTPGKKIVIFRINHLWRDNEIVSRIPRGIPE